jgi:taurine dioxygenase
MSHPKAFPQVSDGVASWQTIEVVPLTPTIGAKVRGADLSRPLPPEQWIEIHQAFLRHLVIFFRGQQRLSPEAQIRFGRLFGELHKHPAAPSLEGYPEVMPVHADEASRANFGEKWHSDVSCDREPPSCTILQMHVLPLTGGDTLFASMYAAWDGLFRDAAVFDGLDRAPRVGALLP